MSKRALAAAVLVAGLATSVEAAPLPGFVLAAQTEHVSFFTRGQAVDATRVERRIGELERLLGQEVGRRVEYYRYATPQEVAAGTGHYAAGVTFAAQGQVHSTEAFHDHELVHVVAGQLGDPGAFFQEGLAVALTNGGKWNGRSADKIARGITGGKLAALIAAFDAADAGVAYPVAGSFVGHLVKAHGVARMADFFRACGKGADVRTQFAAVFGRTIAEAATEWQKAI